MNFEEITTELPNGTTGKVGKATLGQVGTRTVTLANVLEIGQVYTFSCYLKFMGATGATPFVKFNDTTKELTLNEWERVAFTFKATKQDIEFIVSGSMGLYICQAQLERGKQLTDYTPKIMNMLDYIDENGIKSWCYNNDITLINGGKIATGTVKAHSIDTDDLFAQNIDVSGIFNIDNIQRDEYGAYRFKLKNNGANGITFGTYYSEDPNASGDNYYTEDADGEENLVKVWGDSAELDLGDGFAHINADSQFSINVGRANWVEAFELNMADNNIIEIGYNSPDETAARHFNINNIGEAIWNITNATLQGNLSVKNGITVNGNIDVTGNSWKTVSTLGSNFNNYTSGVSPRYRRFGDRVEIEGVVTPKANIAGSSTTYPIFTLPEGYRPTRNVYKICQGTSMNRWLMTIIAGNAATNAGAVCFSRYGTNATATCNAGDWLPFNESFTI